jgi:hypothetical protein
VCRIGAIHAAVFQKKDLLQAARLGLRMRGLMTEIGAGLAQAFMSIE